MMKFLLKLFVPNYRDTENIEVRKKYGLFASFYGLITNFILFMSKIIIGSLLGLFSIVTDSMNNLSDFGNNFISIVGVKASAKKADKEHPYGHQRVEYVLSLIISCIIIGLSMVMMYQSIRDIIIFFKSVSESGKPPLNQISYPFYIVSLSILSIAIFLKLTQAYIYFYLGKKINSIPLKALGKDARNDVLTTSFVIIGIVITWLSNYDFDCFLTLIVSIFVCMSGVGIMKESISPLIGQEPDAKMVQQMIWIIKKYDGVLGLHDLSMHYYGRIIYAIIHVEVDGDESIYKSHEMIDQIEREVFEKMGIHLTIHMDPVNLHDKRENELKEAVLDALKSFSDESINMHDFHIFDEYNHKIVEFELVLPTSIDDEKHHEDISKKIKEKLSSLLKIDFELKIIFDEKVQDFLSEV